MSFRVGAPLLLVFLAVGLLAGEDGIGGIHFNDGRAAFFIGSLALAVVLSLTFAAVVAQERRTRSSSPETSA